MAWYAELKRRNWYCICRFDAITYYSNKLYDEWYESLSDEQKLKLEEIRKKRKEKEERESRESLLKLLMLTGTMYDIALRRMR